jgi:predicted ATPase
MRYGVAQALPAVVEMFVHPEGTQFAIQQPEVHLHPKAQAALGDLIFQLATKEKKQFFIETHSDYTIDRFRLSYKENQGKPKINSQILFFHKSSEGNCVYPIDILENGWYSDNQPESFRQFFIHEEMRLLGL